MSTIDQANNRLCVIGESDPFLALLLQRFAEKSGLLVQFARTGEDVLDLAQREMPGLIILEPELPGKVRGWEAAEALRAGDQASQPHIILCSWLKKDEALALVGQVSAYLQKPDLRYEDFTAALEAAGVKITPGKIIWPD
jgi:DNA-binding response OmpR family regulator